jgi:Flp pilus assembly protein TadG
MTRKRLASRRRFGRTAVEAALVIPLVLMLILGAFEYSRLIMAKQIMDNAAREGARYAVVNTTNSSSLTTAQIQTYVTNYMAGQTLGSQNVSVFQADSTTGAFVSSSWNSASFGSAIGVTVTGNFTPIMPIFFGLPGAIPLTATSVMRSEAN